MSLLVWLPLNGNLNNQGLSPAKFTMINNSGALSVGTTGKTSEQCYQRTITNTADYITSDINFTLDKDYSMCCWCKVIAYGTNNSANGIITQHGHNSGGGGITMKYISDSDYRMSINTGTTSSDRTYMTYYSSTNIYNQWHHLCMTFNRQEQKYRMYIDGKQETILTTGGTHGEAVSQGSNATARPFRIFDWSTDHSTNASYRPTCQLNDVRLYDHCLSQKEISEIAKGLILHYPMDDSYVEPTTNLLNSQWTYTNFSNAPLGSYTGLTNQLNGGSIEIVEFNGQKCLHFNSLGGNNRCYSTLSTQSGKTYTVSVDFYSTKITNDYGLRIERYGGSYNWQGDGMKYTTPGHWQRLHVTFTNSSDTTLYVFFMTPNGTDSYINNIQVEEKNRPTPYTESSRTASTIQDVSGFGNNGTINGTLQAGETPIHYKTSMLFNASPYVSCGKGAKVTDAFTVNWWGKMSNWSNYTRAISCTEGGGWNFEPGGSGSAYMNFACGTGTSSNTYHSAPSKTTLAALGSGWHMFTGTYDGFNAKIYIDGKLEYTKAAYSTKTPAFYNKSNAIFVGAEAAGSATSPDSLRFNGSLSDIRIYATALSEEDIMNLYNNPVSIGDTGSLFAYSIEETGINNTSFDATGTVSAQNFNELSLLSSGMKTKIMPDGSAWARIHYLDVSTNATYFANANEVKQCNEANRFSQMGIVDSFKTSSGIYEFMLTYPNLSSGYNRWTQTSSPNSSTVTGFTPITTAWSAHNGGIRQQGGSSLYNCDTGSTWYAAIGQYGAWTSTQAIPAADGSAQTITELWVRIDNIDLSTSLNSFSILNKVYINTQRLEEI